MKILFDYSIFFHQKYGGISRYFLNLQEQFLKKNIETKIFAPIHNNIFLKNNKNQNISNFYLENYPLFTRKIFKNFNHYSSKLFCKTYKPHVIHKTFYEKNVSNEQCKRIITVYDLIHEIYSKDYNYDKDNKPKEKALESVDKIICISNKTKEDLINFYNIDEKKIDVIYLGIQKFSDFKEKKLIKIEKPFLLYVGDRGKYKNFSNFIKAYSLSKKLKNDFNIICCGGGKITKNEKNFISNLNIDNSKILQIEVTDNELAYLYKNSTALVYPSLYEGFGLPTIEAMSLGCPVICSNHEAIMEAVGKAAKIFDPSNIEEIKNCIEETIYSKDQLDKLKIKGVERSKLFSWEKCAQETLNVYNEID